MRKTQGSVVPQERWIPADEAYTRRHVEGPMLSLPIFFVNRNIEIGFWLPDILQGRVRDLNNGESEAALGGSMTTLIRINWPGYATWSAQVLIRDGTYARNPITLARFMKRVGTAVGKFFNQIMAIEPGTDPRWRIGVHGITQSHVKINGAVNVSAGSWMPNIELRYSL
ncbi:hypothetical protein BJV74DRAFT_284231 [Russula compacta]|nr:hypothetical protein BJV74DRAFT_284231 [Russula compacta]